jgi:pantetheine-phosphate adenylyltransferase
MKVLYPGSFDPVTRGHLDLVHRALTLFEKVTVAVAENITKAPLFTIDERVALLRAELPAGVPVVRFGGLVVDFCRQQGFSAILRGIRTVADFEYEYQMALTNRHLRPEVETVFVMPSVQFSFVSSSLIREIVKHGGDVSAFVPAGVEAQMRQKLRPK